MKFGLNAAAAAHILRAYHAHTACGGGPTASLYDAFRLCLAL